MQSLLSASAQDVIRPQVVVKYVCAHFCHHFGHHLEFLIDFYVISKAILNIF